MAITAATPIALAQVLLNDSDGTNYTATKLIPLLQKAYRELQTKMQKAGLSVVQKVGTPTPALVPALTTVLTDGGGLPNDLLYPMNLYERGSSSENWSPMTELDWEPDEPMGTSLGVYSWREDALHFRGATSARYVRIEYAKAMQIITATSTAIQIPDSDIFLASRCAAIAAAVIGENPTRATSLNLDAKDAWEDFKGTRIKQRQSLPVRRKVNRYRR